MLRLLPPVSVADVAQVLLHGPARPIGVTFDQGLEYLEMIGAGLLSDAG